MSETVTTSGVPDEPDAAKPKAVETIVMPLAVEDLVMSKRVRRTLVRASRTTSNRTEAVEVDLKQEQVVIERVPVGRVVDAVPPVRQEGDVTIMPVVEEELVVVRRLVLKEEVHIRRVQITVSHAETVMLRQQHVTVTRTALDD